MTTLKEKTEQRREDLYLYVINTGEIYRQYTLKAIADHKAKREKYLRCGMKSRLDNCYRATVDAACKSYAKEFRCSASKFTLADRLDVCVALAKYYGADIELGNY